MAKRVALTALLPSTSAALGNPSSQHGQDLPAAAAVEHELPSTVTAPDGPSLAPEAPPSTRARPRAISQSAARAHRHYSELLRKETRLREDQIDGLAQQARRLSRSKTDTSERITDNTLIRIAVDLLLRDPDQLRGNTEHELRKSVGL